MCLKVLQVNHGQIVKVSEVNMKKYKVEICEAGTFDAHHFFVVSAESEEEAKELAEEALSDADASGEYYRADAKVVFNKQKGVMEGRMSLTRDTMNMDFHDDMINVKEIKLNEDK